MSFDQPSKRPRFATCQLATSDEQGQGVRELFPHSLLCYSGQAASGDFPVETSSQVQQEHRGNAVLPLSTSPPIVK